VGQGRPQAGPKDRAAPLRRPPSAVGSGRAAAKRPVRGRVQGPGRGAAGEVVPHRGAENGNLSRRGLQVLFWIGLSFSSTPVEQQFRLVRIARLLLKLLFKRLRTEVRREAVPGWRMRQASAVRSRFNSVRGSRKPHRSSTVRRSSARYRRRGPEQKWTSPRTQGRYGSRTNGQRAADQAPPHLVCPMPPGC
jgi:hypothetical protein